MCYGSAVTSIRREVAYDQAAALGREPQPGLTLLWAARGRTTQALSAVRRMLAEVRNPVARSGLLPAAVEVLVGCGQLDDAREAADELGAIAASFESSALQAMAAYASASISLAAGDPEGALNQARDACRRWLDLDCPYEVARTRVLVGRGLRELGDEESAAAELTSRGRPSWRWARSRRWTRWTGYSIALHPAG